MKDTDRRSAAGGARGRWVVLAVAGAFALGGVALAAQRRPLAESAVRWAFEERGLSPVSLAVSRFDLTGLELSGLRVGEENDLKIDRIEVRYSPSGLLRGRVDALRVAGLRLRGRYGEDGLELPALDPLFASEPGEGGTPSAPALPAANLRLEDARVELDTPEGPATASLSAQLEETSDGRVRGLAELSATRAPFSASVRVDVAGVPEAIDGAVKISLSEDGGATALTLDGSLAYRKGALSLELPSAPFVLSIARGEESLRVEGETPHLMVEGRRVETRGGRALARAFGFEVLDLVVGADVDPVSALPSGRLRVRMRDIQEPPQLPEMVLSGTFDAAPPGFTFALELADTDARMSLSVEGAHDLATASGRADLRLAPLVFTEGGVQPADLLPALRGLVETATGEVEAEGSVSWQGTTTWSGLDLAVRDFSFSGALGELEQLNVAVRLDELWPPEASAGQLVSLARVDVGVELTDGLATYQLRPDGTLSLASVKFQFAGGTIRTAGDLHPYAKANPFVLEVAGVELAQLLTLVDLEGLSGEGVLEGRVPVVASRDAIVIREGRLAAREDGWIRYAPGGGVADSVAAQYGLGVLLGALENFHYDRLELTIDGDASDVVHVGLHLGGSNPDYENGRRVNLNVNVESRLADLLRKGVAAYKVPEVIQQRLEEIGAGSP